MLTSNHEIDDERPLVAPVEAGEVFDDAEHEPGHGGADNRSHPAKDDHDEGLQRELIAHRRVDVKDREEQRG